MEHKLSKAEEQIHRRAVKMARMHRRCEWKMIQVLQEVERVKLYKTLGHSSLFVYAVRALDLTSAVAYSFNSVARAAMKVPKLQESLRAQRISVHRASRLVSVITSDNAGELLEFAGSHSERELDFEVARRNNKAAKREKVRPVSGDQVELTITVSKKTYEMLLRAQNLAAQKGAVKDVGLADTVAVSIEEYLKRNDPVEKAKRAQERQRRHAEMQKQHTEKPHAEASGERQKYRDGRARHTQPVSAGAAPGNAKAKPRPASPKRVPRTAAQDHAVNARDGGCCTYIDEHGRRCLNERWLHVHHIIPVSQGGSNDPANLITLCSFHHDLVHQLSLPIEGQIGWLRPPTALHMA